MLPALPMGTSSTSPLQLIIQGLGNFEGIGLLPRIRQAFLEFIRATG